MHVAKSFPLAQHGPRSPIDSGQKQGWLHWAFSSSCSHPAPLLPPSVMTFPLFSQREFTNLPAIPPWRPELCQALCQAPQTKGLMGDGGKGCDACSPLPTPCPPATGPGWAAVAAALPPSPNFCRAWQGTQGAVRPYHDSHNHFSLQARKKKDIIKKNQTNV